MPSLHDSLRMAIGPCFTARARQQGERCFEQGRVVDLDTDSSGFFGVVVGSRDYEVSVSFLDDTDWNSSCTCPAHASEPPCKHVWALLLAATDVDLEDALQDASRGGLADQPASARPARRTRGRATTAWKRRLGRLRADADEAPESPWQAVEEASQQVRYVLDVDATIQDGDIVVHAASRRRLKRGGWGAPRPLRSHGDLALRAPDPLDQQVLSYLERAPATDWWSSRTRDGGYRLPQEFAGVVLPLLCRTGRFHWSRQGEEGEHPLQWDEAAPWRPAFALRQADANGACALEAWFERAEERLDLADALLILANGFLLTERHLARLDPLGAFTLLASLRHEGPLTAPAAEGAQLLERLLPLVGEAELDAPGLTWAAPATPRPGLRVGAPDGEQGTSLPCTISFDYGGTVVPCAEPRPVLAGTDGSLVRRDRASEHAALRRFVECGGEHGWLDDRFERDGSVKPRQLSRLVVALTAEGWLVEADGKLHRPAGVFRISVSSGTDWFDLQGGIDFDGQIAPLPALLEAARRGDRLVQLDDGTMGLLPEDWLKDWGLLETAAKAEGDALRFGRSQAWLLDALLAGRPEAQLDAEFERARERLAGFRGAEPRREPRGFTGELRPYQREGLGWFAFLRELGLGGCLADDMGLGKTVQVLALLRGSRRAGRPRASACTSLVVVPQVPWSSTGSQEAARASHRGSRVLDFTRTRP